MRKRGALIAGAIVALASGSALAGGFLTNGLPPAGGTQYPFTLPLTGNETLPADTNLSGGQAPQSEAITTGQLAASMADLADPRNYLLNGDIAIAQSGTADTTGGTTTITMAAQAADRWFVDTNVGSGAGHGQVVTSSPTLPAGFSQELKVWRASGALTQQVCAIQAIETTRATQLAGRSVVLSGWLAALAGLSSVADNVNAYVITGTGTDQGLGTLTASPAITPAWTNIAGGTTPAATWSLSTTMMRYNSGSIAIPAGTTEVGVEICFTPASSGAGATDGFAMTGMQLEPVQGSGVTGPSPYDFLSADVELRQAQRFWFPLIEANLPTGAGLNGFCQATGANTNACTLNLPVVMRGKTPTITIAAAGTFKVNIAGTPTTIATPTAGVCSVYACTVTAANTNTTGQAEQLTNGTTTSGAGVWNVASDVVM